MPAWPHCEGADKKITVARCRFSGLSANLQVRYADVAQW